jgi:acetyl esterase
MPLDPPLAAVLDLMSANPAAKMSQGTPEQSRAGFRMLTVGLRDPATLAQVRAVEEATVPGPAGDIPVRIYRPEADGPVPTIVFFHGGGFVIGDLDTHDDHARLLCRDVEAVVVSVDYRLAPEHKFPAGHDDCLAATRWVADHVDRLGGDGARIAVAGDSAGGNLSAAVALAAREEGPALAAQLLLYPGVDFDEESDHPSRVENAEGYFLTAEDMLWFGEHYLPGDDARRDPRASVLHAPDLAGLPPAVVATAEYDPLRDEGEAYAAALEQAGVPVVLRRYDGLIHGFFGLGPVSPAAAAAVAELCSDLRALLRPA